jgi:ribosomal subunit interface protein
MHLTVTGRQLDVGEALRLHVGESLAGIFNKYFGDPIEATVAFAREAHLYRSQISVHVGRHIELQSQATADAPYAAFDAAADRLAKRLRRYKRRLRDHHKTDAGALSATQYVLAGETEEAETETEAPTQPIVIAEMATAIPTLTVGEAVMRLDLGELSAMMFVNRAHGGLNVVYRREDGNIGWIDPRGNPGAA